MVEEIQVTAEPQGFLAQKHRSIRNVHDIGGISHFGLVSLLTYKFYACVQSTT